MKWEPVFARYCDKVVERWSVGEWECWNGIIQRSADIPVRLQMSLDRLLARKIKNIANYGRSVAEMAKQ